MPEKYLKMILNSPVYDVAHETPLDRAPRLSDKLENNVFIKREDLQPVFSFKIRGAYNKIVQLSPSEKQRGVIAASAGNHAQGVALACREAKNKSYNCDARDNPGNKNRRSEKVWRKSNSARG